jgi:hypothetical protein
MSNYTLEPYRISQIDLDNIRYTRIKSNDRKKVIYLKYQDKKKLKNLVFQTPTLLNINNPIDNRNYYELDIPLKGQNTYKENKLINFLDSLDKKILYDAKMNSHKWFDIVNEGTVNYQKIIRNSIDEKYENGMIRIKILRTQDFETILQINNKERITPDNIPQNSWVKMILECYAIWVNQNGFGLFMRPILVSFKPKEIVNYNYNFIDESDNENDELDNIIDTAAENTNIFIKPSNIISDDSTGMTTSQLEFPKIINTDINNTTSSDNNELEIDSGSGYTETSSENTVNENIPLNI